MSNEALTLAPNTKTDRMIDKFVLCIVEACGKGIIEVASLADVALITSSSQKTIGKAIKRLEDGGKIEVNGRAPTVIQFGPYSITLERAPGVVIDDKWAITRAKVFAQKGSECFYCGADASHVDHVVPRARGGRDDMENLVPACATCNTDKGSKTIGEWK